MWSTKLCWCWFTSMGNVTNNFFKECRKGKTIPIHNQSCQKIESLFQMLSQIKVSWFALLLKMEFTSTKKGGCFNNNMNTLLTFYPAIKMFICFFGSNFSTSFFWGGDSTVVSISVCQAGLPGSRPVRPACFRKVECYQRAIDLFQPVLTTGSTKAVHVLSCLCDNACKRSLVICCKSRASCPVSRLLSVPIWPACTKQGR